MSRKKAITPLVSTVVLICFAAVLGLIVMSWGANVVGKAPNECSKVSLSLSREGDAVTVVPRINSIFCYEKKIDIKGVAG